MGKIFYGTYSRSLDPKGRLLLPSKLNLDDVESLYVLRGFEGCLSVYLEDEFQAFLTKLQELDFTDENNREYIRLASASIQKMNVDSHGRILLGKQTLDDYMIGNDVTIIGVLDHFEIWDATAYARYQASASAHYGRSRLNRG